MFDLHPFNGTVELLGEDLVRGALGVDDEVEVVGVVQLHLGVLHLHLEVLQREGHLHLAFADAAEVDGDLAAAGAGLVEGHDEMVVLVAVLNQLHLRTQHYIFAPHS